MMAKVIYLNPGNPAPESSLLFARRNKWALQGQPMGSGPDASAEPGRPRARPWLSLSPVSSPVTGWDYLPGDRQQGANGTMDAGTVPCWIRGWQTFPLKGQRANYFSLCWTTQLYLYSMKSAISNIHTNKHGYVQPNFIYKNRWQMSVAHGP